MSDMPREEVERLMRKAGMSFHLGMPHESVIAQMIRFSSMLRDEILEASEHAIECAMKFEREECAKVCEEFGEEWMCDSHELAKIIRARSNE